MKLSEAIAELEKDNSKEFESETIDFGSYTKLIVEHGMVRCNSFLARGLMLNRKWKEIKNPVSFIEAVQSGKRVRVEHEILIGKFYKGFHKLDELLHEITCDYQGDATKDVILKGKWYIED